MSVQLKRWSKRCVLSFLPLIFALPLSAKASLLLGPEPDISSSSIQVNYSAGTQTFTANGFALQLESGGANPIAGGTFDLAASIDNAGNLISGTLDIGGTIAALGFNSGTLLTGTLTGFTPHIGDPLDFLFNVTGGDAASLYGFGNTGGIILTNTGFPGNFNNDFANNSVGVSDVGVLATAPAPTTLALLGLGLAGLGFARRRHG